MATIIFHSERISPYLWAATLAAAEKGVPYEVSPGPSEAPAYKALHPFSKMPVLQHGDLIVYETAAILHYIDRAFDGPALQPGDALGQANVVRWISVTNAYLFPVMNGIVKRHLLPLAPGKTHDDALVASALASLAAQLRLLDETLSAHPYLAGDTLTLADMFVLPHVHFLTYTPEGRDALEHAPATTAWLERMRARESFAKTNPVAS